MADAPTLKDLAETLHTKLCHWDHNEQCSWLYEADRADPWAEWTHKRYLDKATPLPTKTKLSIENLITAIENL